MAIIMAAITEAIIQMIKRNKPNSYERRMRKVAYEREELGKIFIAS